MSINDSNNTSDRDNAIVEIEALYNDATYSTMAITTSALLCNVSGSNMSGRRLIIIHPKDGTVYLGFNNSVTASTGLPIIKKQTVFYEVSDDIDVYLITSSGTVNIIVQELK